MTCPPNEAIVAFVEGRLPVDEIRLMESHAADCALCRDLLSVALGTGHLQRSMTIGEASQVVLRETKPGFVADLARGANFGRYTILALLGRGGMGEVYAAYDPELDRKVALKLLRPRSGDEDPRAQARLLREAKAMARLSHPNVVTVHDAGAFGGRVFIAMEFVEGATLKDWLSAQARTAKEILATFTDAAKGLAAAHAVGLVHRDFKPTNVMIGRDGFVRVMDFGLARDLSEGRPEAGGGLESPPAMARHGDLTLTTTGELVGTPRYMAPEQFNADVTDARTDQFSFCVSLYEALYGERPFAGDTMLSLMANVVHGDVRQAPDKTRVPGWIRRSLLRGLTPRREDRFASMDELRLALANDPAARRKRWLLAATAALLTATIAAAAHRAGAGTRAVCRDGASRLTGIWELPGAPSLRKQTIRAAFSSLGKSYATSAYAATSRLLDDYVIRWTSMYKDTCEATQVRGEQSTEVLDLRMTCLNGRLVNLRALTDLLVTADAGVVQNAAGAAGALLPVEECADVALLTAVVKPPQDPMIRKRVADLREQLSRVRALRDSGQCSKAETEGEVLVDGIEVTGYSPLLAEALQVMSTLGEFCGDQRLALRRSKKAYSEAVIGHQDIFATEAACVAAFMSARLGNAGSAHDWELIAEASLRRQAGNARLRGEVLSTEGTVLAMDGDFYGFVSKVRESHSVTASALGADHPLALIGLMNIGEALLTAGRFRDAEKADREAIQATEQTFGPANGLVAGESNNLCEALTRLGRFTEAEAACRQALSIWREVGTSSIVLAYGLTGLGTALMEDGHPGAAVAPLEEALAARTTANAAPSLTSESRFALARALWSRPTDRRRALRLARQAQEESASDSKTATVIADWIRSHQGARGSTKDRL